MAGRASRIAAVSLACVLVGWGDVSGSGRTDGRLAGTALVGEVSGGWTTLGEYRVSPRPTSLADRSREPIVVADPFDPLSLAVVYAMGPGETSRPVVRVSRDGGRTWVTRSARLYGGGSHPILAWGPGPRPGRSRLYYSAMGGVPGDYHFEVSHSDDAGLSWHLDLVADGTPGWFGGLEDLVVDRDPGSPNYGAVYLAYLWPKDPARGDGERIVASGDFGRTWSEVEVPKIPSPTGYPDQWRIGYELATAPDGSLYVGSYQVDLAVWRYASPFWKGSLSNIGRIAFGVARLTFDRAARRLRSGPNILATTLPRTAWNLGWALQGVNVSLVDPCWNTGLVVDAGGRVHYAVAGDGRIRLLTSDDAGRTWRSRTLPSVPPVSGRTQRATRPDLVAGPGFVGVLFHTVDATGSGITYGTAAAFSFDRGATWSGPRPVTDHRWRIAPTIATYNGPGLRDRGAILADGRTLFYAYGDGRDGLSAAFGARIRVAPAPPSPAAPPPSPMPTATPTSTVPPEPTAGSSSG